MATTPVQMNQISPDEQFDDKENVVPLQNLDLESKRHTPLADHPSTPPMLPSAASPAPMNTYESPNRSMATRSLPKRTDPTVYYIQSDRSNPSSIMNENRQTSSPIQSTRQTVAPTVFLEPKVISQPVFYSLVGTQTSPLMDNRSSPIKEEPPSPVIYAITGRSRPLSTERDRNNSEVPSSIITRSPKLYSLIDSPPISNHYEEAPNQFLQPSPTIYSLPNSSRIENQIPEPPKQYVQPSPQFYSVTGTAARTSRGVQVNSMEPIQPAPILYTIVGDTPIQTERSHEKPLPIVKNHPTNATTYTLDNAANAVKPPQHQPTASTVYTLDNASNALRPQQQQQQPPIPQPTLYALVNKPRSPPRHHHHTNPSVTKKTTSPPITTTTTTRRNSRGFEHKPEIIKENVITYPVIKTKEPKNFKPEPIVVPVNEPVQYKHTTRQPAATIYRSPEQIRNKPTQLPDNRSTYTTRTTKPYRERRYNNNPLPVISHSHSERRPRQPNSLERYPVNTQPRSVWDYQAQTDDDEEYETKTYKKKRTYNAIRPRAPWIPVW